MARSIAAVRGLKSSLPATGCSQPPNGSCSQGVAEACITGAKEREVKDAKERASRESVQSTPPLLAAGPALTPRSAGLGRLQETRDRTSGALLPF